MRVFSTSLIWSLSMNWPYFLKFVLLFTFNIKQSKWNYRGMPKHINLRADLIWLSSKFKFIFRDEWQNTRINKNTMSTNHFEIDYKKIGVLTNSTQKSQKFKLFTFQTRKGILKVNLNVWLLSPFTNFSQLSRTNMYKMVGNRNYFNKVLYG